MEAGTCPLTSVPDSDVPPYKPVIQAKNACSQAQISAFVKACGAGASAACTSWFSDQANLSCAVCINPLQPDGGATDQGGTMYDANALPFPNLPGCVAIADGNANCASVLEPFLACAYFACECALQGNSFGACVLQTQTGACEKWFNNLTACQNDYSDGGTAISVCQAESPKQLAAVTNVICGSGP